MAFATTMRAAVVQDFERDMVIEEVNLVAPGDHDIVVRTEASAFCITDANQAKGRLGSTLPPMILGHSAVGYVEEIGSGVSRMKVGDRVLVPATSECGVCYFCSHGPGGQCAQHTVPGRHVATRGDGTAIFSGAATAASYATFMNLREISAFRIESDLPADALSMFGCGISSGLGSVFTVAEVEAGASVAIVGAGQFGQWIIQGCVVAGATQIIVVEPRAARREQALRLGATAVVDPADGDPIEQVRALTGDGRGVDVAFEAAGPPAAMEQAFQMARNAGVVVVSGVHSKEATVTFPATMFAVRGRSIRSVQNGNLRMTRDLPAFVRLMESGKLDPYPIMSTHYSLDDIGLAVAAARDGSDLTGIIVP